jgi:hypothetical protein
VRARIFYVNLGRRAETDPIGFEGGDYNLYRYVGNNFVNSTDPSGLKKDKGTVTEAQGVGSCYTDEFKNCCTACGECFDPCAATAAALSGGKKAGWKCGDIVECCLKSKSKKCVTVTINDTGGQEGRLIDFGCCYVIRKGFFPGYGLQKVKCKKLRNKAIKRKCKNQKQCGSPEQRGCQCGGKLKNPYK